MRKEFEVVVLKQNSPAAGRRGAEEREQSAPDTLWSCHFDGWNLHAVAPSHYTGAGKFLFRVFASNQQSRSRDFPVATAEAKIREEK